MPVRLLRFAARNVRAPSRAARPFAGAAWRGLRAAGCGCLLSAVLLGACGRAALPTPAAVPDTGTLPGGAEGPAPVLVPVATPPEPSPDGAHSATPSDAAGTKELPPPPIPILMYHVIDVLPPHAAMPGLYVAPDLFAAQVAALAAAGYQGITLQQAYDIWAGHAAAPPHPIVLSFDDGYIGVYVHAVPVLQNQGWPGVLNLQVGRLGVSGGLTPDQVRAMIQAGWEVDDHTVTHPDLTRLTPDRLDAEIGGAAQRIRQEFGVPVRFFCYPAGRYDPAVVAAVRAAGFLGATTTWPGDAYPPAEGYFTLDRVRVDGGESPDRLVRVLTELSRTQPGTPPTTFPPPPPPTASATPPASSSATPGAAGSSGASGGRTL